MASLPSASSTPTRHPETEVAVPSASTYAPALPRNNYYYQIFLNHRGPDVKKTLASSLYYRLVSHGFKVFLDRREMKEGENITSQIEGAIRSASVHVAIFSPGYAESKWCLDELVLMWNTGSTIIPVFYNVKPYDLRWTQGGKGLYGKALEDLATKKTDGGKPRYDSETIENWRNALLHVAEISGFELEAFNGDEGELIDKVAKRVQELIVTVAEYPYGVAEKVEHFEDFEKTDLLLQQQQHSGKLPSEIESTLKISYDGLNSEGAEYRVDEKVEDFEKTDLLQQQESGKLPSEIESTLKISYDGLNPEEAEYPYGVDEKVEDFEDFEKTGLLQQQQSGKLPSEIESTLKISYDGLNPEEKEIFSDIVSFFIGEKRDMAIKIWDGSGWNGSLAFQSLQDKSLVEVDSENKIKILHNHHLDMGRKAASSGSPRRLWRCTEHIDDLLQQLYNDQVRGIKTDRDLVSTEEREVRTACYHVSGHESKPSVKNTKLQLLDVEGNSAFILKKLHPTNLIWLRWRNCSSSSLPDWVPMDKLRVLEVNSSILKKLWKGKGLWKEKGKPQAPLALRELVITSPLSELPNSIGDLAYLELMELTNCSEIKSLPDSLGKLKSLKHIDLSGSKKLEKLPDSFDCLASLKVMKLRDCSEIKSLPDSMGKLTNLEHIDLSLCKNLERLPKTFGDLTMLRYLDLSRCNYLTIDRNTLGKISKLEYIDLSDCEKITSWPPQVLNQQSLEKLYGPFLQMVPSPLDGNLKDLKLWKGSKFEKLEGLPIPRKFLTQLAKLTVNECVFPERSFPKNEAETGASTLKHVQLQHMELCKTEISEVSFAEGFCPNLRQLLINSCDRLEKVGTLPDALETLELTRCKELKKIEGLCGLAKLQKLKIKACRKLEELSSIETLVSLERLVVSECGKLKRIEGLSQLTKLRRLNLSKCSELEELPGVEHLMSLKSLVKECPKLQRSSPENSSGQSST